MRDYKKEYQNYHGRPEQIKNRSSRNKARRQLKREGRVSDGDGKDVDHRDGDPQNNARENLRVRDRHYNRADKSKSYATAAKLLSLAQKAGARHSSKDNDLIQQMHDKACELGAKCQCEGMGHPQLKSALVLRHPGHPNQKVHGNRFGGFSTTKESLRRLKGDKEARERYKAAARNKTAKARKQMGEDIDTQVEVNRLNDQIGELKHSMGYGLKPKYRKEREAKVRELEGQINELKLTRVRPGSFVKQKGTSLTGVVTGKGTIKAGKETIPVFRVRTPGGGKSIIPVRETDIVSL